LSHAPVILRELPQITLESVTFLEQERLFPIGFGHEKGTKVAGVFIAKISSDVDLIEYEKDNYVTRSFDATACSNKKILGGWSGLIPSSSIDRDRYYYDLLIDYKNSYNESSEIIHVNLLTKIEDICINLYFADPFVIARSNVIRYTIPEKLLNKVQAYDDNFGCPSFRGVPIE
jgi:hypothetical protein